MSDIEIKVDNSDRKGRRRKVIIREHAGIAGRWWRKFMQLNSNYEKPSLQKMELKYSLPFRVQLDLDSAINFSATGIPKANLKRDV